VVISGYPEKKEKNRIGTAACCPEKPISIGCVPDLYILIDNKG